MSNILKPKWFITIVIICFIMALVLGATVGSKKYELHSEQNKGGIEYHSYISLVDSTILTIPLIRTKSGTLNYEGNPSTNEFNSIMSQMIEEGKFTADRYSEIIESK